MERTAVSVTCERCGEAYETKSFYHKWCHSCAKLQARDRARQFEKDTKHPCPKCGVEIARTSDHCKVCGAESRIEKITGCKNHNWKGGRSVDQWGYVQILVAPEARKGHRYRAEHILVWEAANGPLPDGFIVHHKNHIKDDNRLENLEAMSRSAHNQAHGEHTIKQLEEEIRQLRERVGEL